MNLILTYLILGAVFGLAVRLLFPGDPRLTWAWTMVAGAVGGALFGMGGIWLGIYRAMGAGVISAFIGAFVFVGIARMVTGRRSSHPQPQGR